MKKEYGVCTSCNGHAWLVWNTEEDSPYVEACKACNNGDKPRPPGAIKISE